MVVVGVVERGGGRDAAVGFGVRRGGRGGGGRGGVAVVEASVLRWGFGFTAWTWAGFCDNPQGVRKSSLDGICGSVVAEAPCRRG